MDRKLFARRMKNKKYPEKYSKSDLKKMCTRLIKYKDPVLGVKGGYWLAKTEEELAELTEAVSHVLFHKNEDKIGVLEEMADVYISLELTRQVCGIKETELGRAVRIKMARMEERMERWDKDAKAKEKSKKKISQKKTIANKSAAAKNKVLPSNIKNKAKTKREESKQKKGKDSQKDTKKTKKK